MFFIYNKNRHNCRLYSKNKISLVKGRSPEGERDLYKNAAKKLAAIFKKFEDTAQA